MATKASRGVALRFDPQYVSFALEVWSERRLTSARRSDLEALIHLQAETYFVSQTAIGCHEEAVSPTKISQALTLLKGLQLIKQTATGPKDGREIWITATPTGEALLYEQPSASGLRPLLAQAIVAGSSDLLALLRALLEHGSYTQPVLQIQPSAPRRGATYSQAVIDGIAAYQARSDGLRDDHMAASPPAKKLTTAQLLKSAQAVAGQRHPVSKLRSLDVLVSLAARLGLLWIDDMPVNPVIAARQIGLASSEESGAFTPNIPDWKMGRSEYVGALITAHAERSDSTGFAPIGALRGAVGRILSLSPAAVNVVLVLARDAGDRGEIPIALQFEPNEDLLYSPERNPLIWQGHAYDFVEVRSTASIPGTRVQQGVGYGRRSRSLL